MIRQILTATLVGACCAAGVPADDELVRSFQSPPDDAKPWVFMWWFHTITPADITHHMEELKAKGVGGLVLFDLGGMPGAPFLSDPWRELFRHTVGEAGELIDSVEITDRFLADVRRTIADCVADWHYGRWAELAHAHGMKVRAEAGGPHHPRLLCCDGLMNQGRMDEPVAEFWENEFWKENQWAPTNHHGVTTMGWQEAAQNVNAKQAASAAHLYGKRIVASESFTSFGRRKDWGVAPADLLVYANIAFCEGINALTIHGSATSGRQDGKPGTVFGAGTHFNHNVTWWDHGGGFLRYLARCQQMLRQGLFLADVLYYNGDEAPNFVPPKYIDPSRGFGYDYDVCNTEILLERLSVKDGRIILPDGMSYQVLVLPERPVLPLAVAEKIEQLVTAGATVIGPKPQRTPGLTDYPRSEQRLKEIADRMWGKETGGSGGGGSHKENAAGPVLERSYGRGRVIFGSSIREVLQKTRVAPDFAFQSNKKDALVDFIHRRDGETEIYFVANRRGATLNADCIFRVSGRQPELWDPVSGTVRDLPEFQQKAGRTTVPLEFEPHGSMFIVFRKRVTVTGTENFVQLRMVQEITGPWTVQFDPQWFYPTNGLSGEIARGAVVFEELQDWSVRAEPAIQHFSGAATYRKNFTWSGETTPRRPLFLDLGTVKETARVRLNGKNLGVVWCAPWRVDLGRALKPGVNTLEIEVINLWPNRLIGDSKLPAAERRTRSNIRLDSKRALLASGLLGPVRVMTVGLGDLK